MGQSLSEVGGASFPCAPTDDLRLSTQLCFSLYAATNRLSRIYGSYLEPFGLTFPQTLGLMALWEKSPQTVGAIARVLELDNGTITPILKRLEHAGFVVRIRDKADERRVLVHLTAKGRAVREPILEARRTMLFELDVSDKKLSTLKDVIDQIATRIDAVPPPDGTGTGTGAEAMPRRAPVGKRGTPKAHPAVADVADGDRRLG